MKITRLFVLLLVIASACTPVRGPVWRSLPVATLGFRTWPDLPLSTLTPVPTLTPQPTATPQPTPTPSELAFPIRAVFYDPGFPQGWQQNGMNPYTRYHPGLGFYTQDDPALVRQHIAAMQHGKIQAGIAAWGGQGSPSDARMPLLLQAAVENGFHWALEVKSESQGDPDPAAIQADLVFIRDRFAGSPAYLRVEGRFVVFVDASAEDGCGMIDRWQQANTVGAYLVLRSFNGFGDCPAQPDGWYPPFVDGAQEAQTPSSYAIRPGFWKPDEEQPHLARSLKDWTAAVRAMVASRANFQLVVTFNAWGEGSAVEDAWEWPSPSGYGRYLDALHFDGNMDDLFPYRLSVPLVQQETPVVLIGAGDIARCGATAGAEETALLLGKFLNAAIFTAGDNVQDIGAAVEYQDCFEATWGRYKDRIRPAVGNHDTYSGMTPYFDYFGAVAGDRDKGYYSYELGAWHIIVLNSDCQFTGGCATGSPQEQWLKADLADHPARCTLAYWHNPLFTSSHNSNPPEIVDWWRDLYDAGVELVINGHDHEYERFALLDPGGNLDEARGIREFIAGSGGVGHYHVEWEHAPNSVKLIQDSFGLLKLELSRDSYAWEFIPVDGTETDSGVGVCH